MAYSLHKQNNSMLIYRLALILVLHLQIHSEMSAADTSTTQTTQDSKSRLASCMVVLAKIAFAPIYAVTFAPLSTVTAQDDKSIDTKAMLKSDKPRSTHLRSALKYLAISFALTVGLHALINKYTVTPYKDFYSLSEPYLHQKPERVLVINGSSEEDPVYIEFKKLLLDNSNPDQKLHFIKVNDLQDLKVQLEQLSTSIQIPFDRIEFFAHGKPQTMHIDKEINKNDISTLFANTQFPNLTSSKSDLRLWSCSLGRCASNTNHMNEHEIEALWAKTLLPHGGKIVVSPRDILIDNDPITRAIYGILWTIVPIGYDLVNISTLAYPELVKTYQGGSVPKTIILTFDENGKPIHQVNLK